MGIMLAAQLLCLLGGADAYTAQQTHSEFEIKLTGAAADIKSPNDIVINKQGRDMTVKLTGELEQAVKSGKGEVTVKVKEVANSPTTAVQEKQEDKKVEYWHDPALAQNSTAPAAAKEQEFPFPWPSPDADGNIPLPTWPAAKAAEAGTAAAAAKEQEVPFPGIPWPSPDANGDIPLPTWPADKAAEAKAAEAGTAAAAAPKEQEFPFPLPSPDDFPFPTWPADKAAEAKAAEAGIGQKEAEAPLTPAQIQKNIEEVIAGKQKAAAPPKGRNPPKPAGAGTAAVAPKEQEFPWPFPSPDDFPIPTFPAAEKKSATKFVREVNERMALSNNIAAEANRKENEWKEAEKMWKDVSARADATKAQALKKYARAALLKKGAERAAKRKKQQQAQKSAVMLQQQEASTKETGKQEPQAKSAGYMGSMGVMSLLSVVLIGLQLSPTL